MITFASYEPLVSFDEPVQTHLIGTDQLKLPVIIWFKFVSLQHKRDVT